MTPKAPTVQEPKPIPVNEGANAPALSQSPGARVEHNGGAGGIPFEGDVELQPLAATSVSEAPTVPASRYSDTAALIPPDFGSSNTRYVRRPIPIIEPGPRWCKHCKLIKPDRTHHCRHCGTCVLQFDREPERRMPLTSDHCVWIGRCVGWKNHAVSSSFKRRDH